MHVSEQNDISIILVGLNASDFIRECIESLNKANWLDKSYEIIYVDNDSSDDSIAMCKKNFPEVRLIENPGNYGFCKAANQGADISNSRYYYFLNDDTIVIDDAIAMLVDYLDTSSEIGVVGSRLLNTDMTDQWSGRRFPTPLNAILGRRSYLSKLLPNVKVLSDYLYRDKVNKGIPFSADWVSAAALMVRKDDFHAIGGFAEDYYYWHEAIFCDRIRKIGKSVYLHPQSKIIHYEGKGSGKRPYKVRKWHIIDFHQGAYRCYCEHYNLGLISMRRWFAASTLFTRALLLLASNKFS